MKDTSGKKLKLTFEPIDSISPMTDNARSHSDRNKQALMDSIRLYGIRKPIVVHETNRQIYAGNLTYECACELGFDEIPVAWIPTTMSTDEAKRFAVMDNRSAELAEWNFDSLKNLSFEMEDLGIDIGEIGFTQEEINEVFAQNIFDSSPDMGNEPEEEERAIEYPDIDVQLGDIWTLGKHRVICGDCTKTDVVRELMQEQKATLMLTDPPYGISKEDKLKNSGGKLSDFNITWDKEYPYEFLIPAINALELGGSVISFCESNGVSKVWEAFEKAGIHPLNTIHWKRTNPPPNARKNFMFTMESGVFGRKKGKVLVWNGGGITSNTIESTICSGKEKTIHPTQKPVSVIVYFLKILSNQNHFVLDPFLGSGTTLIACEQTYRICYGCEINPDYVKIIIDRYLKVADRPKVNYEREGQVYGFDIESYSRKN